MIREYINFSFFHISRLFFISDNRENEGGNFDKEKGSRITCLGSIFQIILHQATAQENVFAGEERSRVRGALTCSSVMLKESEINMAHLRCPKRSMSNETPMSSNIYVGEGIFISSAKTRSGQKSSLEKGPRQILKLYNCVVKFEAEGGEVIFSGTARRYYWRYN